MLKKQHEFMDDFEFKTYERHGDEIYHFVNVEDYSPIFSFKYVSMKQTDFCFDSTDVLKEDYHAILNLFKRVSDLSYRDIYDYSKKEFRFHSIDSSKLANTKYEEFKQLIEARIGTTRDQLPTLYQLAVYTNIGGKAPRIIGFLDKLGLFHIIWFDYHHKLFPQKLL